MRKIKIAAIAAVVMGISGLASAASDGTLGATSSGSFINTFYAAPAKVQVLKLKDATFNTSTVAGSVNWDGGNVAANVTDSFCVVNTAAASVKLTATSANGYKSGTTVRNAVDSTGAKLANGYILAFGTDGKTFSTPGGADLDTKGFTVPAANVVISADKCPTNGNVYKSIVLGDGTGLAAGTAIYTDTVTITATPL